MFAVQLYYICSARCCTQSYVTRLEHTHALLCPNMCARTHILTSHQCIIIPKQTIINEPCNAYLSERRQLPPPLPLGWGCYSDRFIDIWRERGEGELGGRGGAAGLRWRGDRRQGDGYQFEDVGTLPFAFVFVFHLSISCPCQSVLSERTVHELFFFNQVSVRRHLGCISWGKRLILEKHSMYKGYQFSGNVYY